jgi:hypothetical protein
MGINWQQFGLKGNPYNTKPLVEGGDLPIEKVFIGRAHERDMLDKFFSEESGCMTVCGKAGVGKTSLINYEKHLLKKLTDQPPLFSFRREIEANIAILDKRSFILELISSIIREIKLRDPVLLETDPNLRKIQSAVDIIQSLSLSDGVNAFGFGLQFGGTESSWKPPQLTLAVVEEYLNELIDLVVSKDVLGEGYRGIIVHVNNFDVVCTTPEAKKMVINFFQEIRDLLQLDKLFYVFLGPSIFFKEIISAELRVKAVFQQTPIIMTPLSKTEIIQAIDERMGLLKLEDVSNIIKPFNDESVYKLYDLYEGDIRSILSAMKDILVFLGDKITDTLGVDETMLLLGRERLSQVQEFLTEEKLNVLRYIVQAEKEVSQKQIAEIMNKEQANISGYYFTPLKDAGIIEECGRQGNEKFWKLTKKYECLKFVLQSQKNVEEKAKKRYEQGKMF